MGYEGDSARMQQGAGSKYVGDGEAQEMSQLLFPYDMALVPNSKENPKSDIAWIVYERRKL